MEDNKGNVFGLPDYIVTKFNDDDPLSDAIVELNLEKAEIKYIKSFLETEGNPASETDVLLLTTRRFKELKFSTELRPKDIEEVFAMRDGMRLLFDNYKKPITPEIILHYNFCVVAGEKKFFSGKLRGTDLWVKGVSYKPPDFNSLPRLFENMFMVIDHVEGSINKAISLLLAISKNQFFIAGNKRTARLVALHQLANGKQRLLSPMIDTVEYLIGLKEFYETGDNSRFSDFFYRNLYTL